MARFWHDVGVYFGFVEPDEADLRAARETPPLSLPHAVMRLLIGVAVGGLIVRLVTGSVRAGIEFGLALAVLCAVLWLWDRRR